MYVWDEHKRQSNLEKHGLDFTDAHLVYENPAKLAFQSLERGEDRHVDIALVEVAGLVLALIYVLRDGDVRVISFRRASKTERRLYAKAGEQQN